MKRFAGDVSNWREIVLSLIDQRSINEMAFHENAGLRRDAIRSQVIDALEAQEIKETGILIPSDFYSYMRKHNTPDAVIRARPSKNRRLTVVHIPLPLFADHKLDSS